MNVLRTIRNYYCYCGIEKDEYNAVKKDAYVSNFEVWRVLHILMAVVFGVFYIGSFFNSALKANSMFYLLAFLYSVAAIFLLLVLKKDSILAQFLIYLSISLLFLFSCFISQNKPNVPATTFIVFLLVTPMFMIDKPYFMTIELCAASAVFLVWMYYVKPYDVWQYDLANVVTFTIIGIILNVIANSIRIREFVLTREIRIQKDTDEMTGLMNKGSLTRAINDFFADDSKDKGILLIMDVDRFKSINDTYGHDIGDRVISQIGSFLGGMFTKGEIVGRFGGDEFIVFVEGTDDLDVACEIANEIICGAPEAVVLPDEDRQISVSVGVAIYNGREKNYSEIFKKADIALYQSKADPNNAFYISE